MLQNYLYLIIVFLIVLWLLFLMAKNMQNILSQRLVWCTRDNQVPRIMLLIMVIRMAMVVMETT